MESGSLSLVIIVFCIIMSAYFSATETAFSSLNRIRVKNMAEKGNKRAELVMRLSESYDSLLSTILIGNNIVNIASASLATVLFVKMLGDEAGASVSTVVTTVVVLIFGEVSPKSIAKESPEKFAMFSAPMLNVFVILLTPINFLFKQWKKLLSLIVKTSSDPSITEEELLTIVEEAKQEGGIDGQERTLIRSANIEKVFEILGKDKEFEVLTVSGWVMEQIGRIPKEGDSFIWENPKVQVKKMAGKRVEKVQIEILPELVEHVIKKT